LGCQTTNLFKRTLSAVSCAKKTAEPIDIGVCDAESGLSGASMEHVLHGGVDAPTEGTPLGVSGRLKSIVKAWDFWKWVNGKLCKNGWTCFFAQEVAFWGSR